MTNQTDLSELASEIANKLSRDAILRQHSPVDTLRAVFIKIREEGRYLGKVEDGWVIEHGASEGSRPRYWGGVHGWTYDNLQAVRFVRKIDAQSVAESMDDGVPGNYRLAEHAYPHGRRAGSILAMSSS